MEAAPGFRFSSLAEFHSEVREIFCSVNISVAARTLDLDRNAAHKGLTKSISTHDSTKYGALGFYGVLVFLFFVALALSLSPWLRSKLMRLVGLNDAAAQGHVNAPDVLQGVPDAQRELPRVLSLDVIREALEQVTPPPLRRGCRLF